MYSYKYPRAALTVDSIILAKNNNKFFLLLIKRGANPFKGLWAFPGGFINLNETLEEACARELTEETGLKIKNLKQFKAYDAINRDPRHRTISVVFYSYLENISDVKGMDDAVDAKWFELKNLPNLAFDHNEIIAEFISQKKLFNLG